MARTKISEFSATPGNNTDIDSINIAEGCAPSGINDAIRELMAQLKDFQTGAVGDSFNGPVGTTTAAAGAFTTLAASGAVTLSGGTANGVPYLNGSKVLTSGSALVFDGTNLGIGTSSPAGPLEVVTQNTNDSGIYLTADGSSFGYASSLFFRSKLTNGGSIGVAAKIRAELSSSNNAGLLFFTTASGTNAEKMRLDSSGNLGLGVTPSAWASGFKAFQVAANTAMWGGTGATGPSYFSNNVIFDGARKYINTAAASEYQQNAGRHEWYTAPSGTAGAAISFTQAMTLDASGSLLVGTTTVTATGIGGATFVPQSLGRAILRCGSTSNVAGTELLQFYNSSGMQGVIQTNATGTAYTSLSDYRLKEDIAPMTGALAKVAALKPVTYKWKIDGSEGQGFIAHELQAVVSECATGTKDAVDEEGNPKYQGIDTSFLVATLTAAIQEQQALILTLQADVAALKAAA